MSNAQWFVLIGALLLFMGLTTTPLKRSPVTSAIIYLAVGLLVGPTVLHLFHFNPLKESALLEVLTEVAVLISLFSAGVKMPVPFSLARWRAPVLLATAVDGDHAWRWWPRSPSGCWACHWVPASCWAPSSRRPTRCWPPTCRSAIPATATSCAST